LGYFLDKTLMLFLCLQLKETTAHMHNECAFYAGIV